MTTKKNVFVKIEMVFFSVFTIHHLSENHSGSVWNGKGYNYIQGIFGDSRKKKVICFCDTLETTYFVRITIKSPKVVQFVKS